MKTKFRNFLILLTGLFLLLPLVAFGGPKYGGTLVIANEVDPTSMDPHRVGGSVDGLLRGMMLDGLVDYDRYCNIRPSLATSWDITENGKVYTFYLRRNARFHNGRYFTADDVIWNLNRITSDPNSPVYARTLHNIEKFEKVDDYTVKITLKEANYVFLTELANNEYNTPMVAKESPVNKDGDITRPIGTGPFMLDQWTPTVDLVMKRSPYYWIDGLPYLDAVKYTIVSGKQARLNALKTGAVHVAGYLEAEKVKYEMDKNPEGVTYSFFQAGYPNMYSFNLSRKPFTDKRVRQAIAHAISKEDVLYAVFGGFGDLIAQPVSPDLAIYTKVEPLAQDYEKAKQLLKEAGYPNGFEISICTSNAYPHLVRIAQIFQANLAPIGIKVKMDISDWATTIQKWIAGNFDVMTIGLGFSPDPYSAYNGYMKTGAPSQFLFGPNGWGNKDIDRLTAKVAKTADFMERKAIYAEMAKIVVEEAPWIFTVFETNPGGRSNKIKGFEPALNSQTKYWGGGYHYAWLEEE